MLGEITRHLLLMTATSHSGKEEDFQLFLTLLDRDRFEGRHKVPADTSGIMRRMVKEDLLTFEGKKLFPERVAEAVPYELTAVEYHQEEVCRLWNLVAFNTREGEVFTRLLRKLEEMRKAYGGKVFDVLGEAFTETPLRNLLMEAIQYGERADVRAKMHQVIDASVGDGVKELLEERALAADHLTEADLAALRAAVDEARARRLQSHYIELAFKEAFTRFGGRIARRERGRYEIATCRPISGPADMGPSRPATTVSPST